jgi:molybdenum cofactor biosynthesis enzyme MoaA
LNPLNFKKMTRTGDLNNVLDGIEHAITLGFKAIKVEHGNNEGN